MATLASLVVRVGAEIEGFATDMRRAETLAKRHSDGMKKAAAAAGAAIGTAFAGAAVGTMKLVADQAKAADGLNKLAMRLGTTTEALSQMQFVAERSGVKFETLTMGLQRMTRRIGEVAKFGKGEAAPALSALGLEAEKLVQLPLDQQFETIAEELSKVENTSIRTSLAMKLFDSEGVALVQTMGEGKAGIQALREEADRLNLTIGGDTADAATKFIDLTTNLSAVFDGFKNALAEEFLPILNSLIENYTNAEGASGSMAQAAGVLADVFKFLASAVIVVKNVLEALADILIGIAAAIAEVFAGVADALMKFIGPAAEALDALVQGDFARAKEAIMGFGDGVVDGLIDAGAKAKEAIAGGLGAASDDLTEGFDALDAIWRDTADTATGDLIPAMNQTGKSAEQLASEAEALKKAQEAAAKKAEELAKAFADIQRELNPTQALADEFARKVRILATQIDETSYTTEQFRMDVAKLKAELEKNAEATDENVVKLRQMRDELFPVEAAARAFEEQMRFLEDQLANGNIPTQAEYNRIVAAATESYAENVRGLVDMGDSVDTEMTAIQSVVENTFKRLDDTLASFWQDMLKDGEFSFDSLKDIALDALAQMIHAYTTQRLTVSMGAQMTGAGTGVGGQTGPGGSLFGQGGLLGGNSAGGFMNMVRGFFGQQQGQGWNWGFGTNQGGFNNSAAGAAIGIFGGSALGNMIDNGDRIGGFDYAGTGAMVGAIVGSIIPVIGTMIGSLIGGVLGGAFGRFFGRSFEGGLGGENMRTYDDNTQIDTVFGPILGLYGRGGVGRFEEAGSWLAELGPALQEFDATLAQFLTADQMERVTEAFKNWTVDFNNSSSAAEQIFNSRFGVVLDAFPPMIRDFVDQVEGLEPRLEAFERIVVGFNTLQQALAEFTASDLRQAMEDMLNPVQTSLTDIMSTTGARIRELMDAFDPMAEDAPERMVEIAGLIQQRYQAELAYLSQVISLIQQIGQSIATQRQQIEDALRGPDERTVDELMAGIPDLIAQIGMAESAEDVARLVQEAQALVGNVFQQAQGMDDPTAIFQTLLGFLDQIEEISTAVLEGFADDAIAGGEQIREEAKAFAEEFSIPLEMTTAAVNDVGQQIGNQTNQLLESEAMTREAIREVRAAVMDLRSEMNSRQPEERSGLRGQTGG